MAIARIKSSREVAVNAAKKGRKKAGHRSWAPRGGVIPGGHTGDIISVATRSVVMSRIRGKDTSPEREIGTCLLALGLKFECHPKDIPGRPDILFRRARVAVFIDGDFWHGWRFPLWRHKLSDRWVFKIESNRLRDQKNMRRLRQMGWAVVRIWEHQVEQDRLKCIERVIGALHSAGIAVRTRR